MKKIGIIYIFSVLLTTALTGCVSDEPAGTTPAGTMDFLEADISPIGPQTRVVTANGDDYWSYARFSTGDTIGFYSKLGNLAADGGNGSFINEPMVYNRSTGNETTSWRGVFNGVNMDYDASIVQSADNTAYVYFPYSKYMEGNGVELRREATNLDGTKGQRCMDALYIMSVRNGGNSGAILSGTFVHAFSEVMITRGYGFDNPVAPPGEDPWKITFVLDKGYSHLHIIDNNTGHTTYWKLLQPYYNEEYGKKTGMTEQDCRRWVAWEGHEYKPTELAEAQRAWYCMLPTGMSTNRATVDYIELYDNMGTLQKITSFSLYELNSKRLQPNDRYQLQAVMEGLVPTIYPYSISPWDDVTDITDKRSNGINDPSELLKFISTYNAYITSDRSNTEYEEELKTYGDRYEKDGVVGWHFYISQNLDLNSNQTEVGNYRINNLCDTIDGMNRTISSLLISGNSGFIGELREGGCLMNLNIEGLNVINSYSPTQTTGGLVDVMSGGLVTGCSVDGEIRSPGLVGMAAGQMTGGTITGSTFTGLLIGNGTYNNILGTQPTGSFILSGNNSGGLFFTRYN